MNQEYGKEVSVIAGNTKRIGLCVVLSILALLVVIFISFFTNIISNLWGETTMYTIAFKVGATAFTGLLTIVFIGLLVRNQIIIYENGVVVKRGIKTRRILYSEITKMQTRNFKREYPGGKDEMIYYYDVFTNKTNFTLQSTSYIDLKPSFDYVVNKVNGVNNG